jgi:polysaccharide biosynthesis transport protein
MAATSPNHPLPPEGPQPGWDGSTATTQAVLLPARVAPQRPGYLGAPPPVLSATPTVLALLLALRRRWALAVSLGLPLGAAVGFVLWYVAPVRYTAKASLRVLTNKPALVFNSLETSAEIGSYRNNQVAIIRSRLLLNAALRDPKVKDLPVITQQPDPVAWLEKEVNADFGGASEILRISLAAPTKEEAKAIVNAVREVYLKTAVDGEYKKRRDQFDQLKKLEEGYADKLVKRKEIQKKLAQTFGSKNSKELTVQRDLAMSEFMANRTQWSGIKAELRRLDIEIAAQQAREKDGDKASVPEDLLEEAIQKDWTMGRCQADLKAAEDKLADRKKKLEGPNHPSYKKALAELQEAKQAVAKCREELRPKLTEELRAKLRREAKASLQHNLLKREMLQRTEEALQANMTELAKQTRDIAQGAGALEEIHEDISVTEGIAKQLATKVEALEVELQAPPRVEPMEEEAYVSELEDKLRPVKMGGMAGGGTFGLILLAVSLLEFRSRRVNNADEIVHGLKMRLVGTVPQMPERRAGGLFRASPDPYWKNLLTESIDATRTMLLHAAQSESVRVVMVTSALQGEGKTSLSSHLAASLARAGRRIVLIDGDLRRPSLHRLLEQPEGPGLAECLRGEAALADAVRPTTIGGLSLLPAGQCSPETLVALAQDGMGELVRQLRDQYEFVLVDSSPVLPVADAPQIGRHMDAVIFSVLRDVSRLPSVYAAHERLAMLGIRVLGAVVSGARTASYGSYYSNTSRS